MNLQQLETFEARFYEAEKHLNRGEFQLALELYIDLLAQRLSHTARDEIPFMASDLVVIERLADLSILIGNFEAADDLLSGMLTLARDAGNLYTADYTSIKRIHFTLEFGHLRKAFDLLVSMTDSLGDIYNIDLSSTGLKAWEGERTWDGTDEADRAVIFSRIYHVMGAILAANGQYNNALSALERGLYYSSDNSPPFAKRAFIPLKLLTASATLEKGNLEDIRKILAEITPKLDKKKEPGFYVRWLEISGKLELLIGDYGEALQYFQDAVDVCQGHGFAKAQLNAALNFSHVQIFLNQTAKAKKTLNQVIQSSRKLGDTTIEIRASYLLNLATARSHSLVGGVAIAPSVSEMWKAKKNDSIFLDNNALNENPLDLPQSNNFLSFFEDRILGFYWYLGYANVEAAAGYLSQLIQVFELTDSILIQLRLKVLIAIIAYYQENYQQAEMQFKEVRPVLNRLQLKPELWQVQRFLGWCELRLNRSPSEQHALAEETKNLLSEITETLSGPDRAIFLLNKWTADEEYIASEIEQLIILKAHILNKHFLMRFFLRWRLWKRIDSLLSHIDAYKDVIAKRSLLGQKFSMPKDLVPSLWNRLIRTSRKRATFSFLVLPDRVLIISSGWLSLDFRVSPITRIQVRELVEEWHRIIEMIDTDRDLAPIVRKKAVDDSKVERSQIASYLAESLQIPQMLRQLPKRTRALHIIPDDCLHGFPFAAIAYDDKYLPERYALSIGFEHDIKRKNAKLPEAQEALLVGVSQGTGSIPSLPGVSVEMDIIEGILKSRKYVVHKLMDYEADVANVLEQLPKSRFFHIACHGTFEPDRPDQSGLLLIPAPEQLEILSIRDLSQLNLTRLAHITLSSCWSADNFVLPGRWIISLPETLWRAGTQSILGSLWPVDDSFAVAFMKKFYEYLESQPRDKALQNTQLDCLENRLSGVEHIDTRDPINWAAFNLYGDSTQLNL